MELREYLMCDPTEHMNCPEDEGRFMLTQSDISINDAITAQIWAMGYTNRSEAGMRFLYEIADSAVMEDVTDDSGTLDDIRIDLLQGHLEMLNVIAKDIVDPIHAIIIQHGAIESIEDVSHLDDGTLIITVLHHPQRNLL